MQKKNVGFCDRLKDFRDAKDISKAELARTLGVSDRSIGHWERGERIPSAENLSRLADVMHTTMDDLWKGRVTSWSKT
jgi:transcriptional regulator with XRE-family HTH domain